MGPVERMVRRPSRNSLPLYETQMRQLLFRVVIPGGTDLSVYVDSSIEGLPMDAWVVNNIPRILKDLGITADGQPLETLQSLVPRSGPRST